MVQLTFYSIYFHVLIYWKFQNSFEFLLSDVISVRMYLNYFIVLTCLLACIMRGLYMLNYKNTVTFRLSPRILTVVYFSFGRKAFELCQPPIPSRTVCSNLIYFILLYVLVERSIFKVASLLPFYCNLLVLPEHLINILFPWKVCWNHNISLLNLPINLVCFTAYQPLWVI